MDRNVGSVLHNGANKKMIFFSLLGGHFAEHEKEGEEPEEEREHLVHVNPLQLDLAV